MSACTWPTCGCTAKGQFCRSTTVITVSPLDHQSAIRAAREDALREAAQRIGKLAVDDPKLSLATARAVAICEALIGEKP